MIDEETTGADAFDVALAQFETATAETEPVTSEPSTPEATARAEAEAQGLDGLDLDRYVEERLPALTELASVRGDLAGRAHYERSVLLEAARHQQQELLRQRDELDGRELQRTLSRELPGFARLSDDQQKGLLRAVYHGDEKVQRDWHARYESPRGWQNRAAQVAATIAGMVPDGYDGDITADRMAVADAVRGHGRRPPAPPAPSYGNMTDSEFGEALNEMGIGSGRTNW